VELVVLSRFVGHMSLHISHKAHYISLMSPGP